MYPAPGALWFALTLLAAGCAGPARTPPPSPTSGASPPAAPATVPEAAPAPEPSLPPAPVESSASPTPAPAAVDPAAQPVVDLLRKQLHVPLESIRVEQVARAEWPDTCLGLAAEGEICAAQITPGFAVSVVVNDQRYEFRTDESGRRICLAFAPLAETGETLLTWRDASSFDALVIGTQRIGFGLRGRPLLVTPLPVPERAPELMGFLSRFAPFYARTPAGEITFRGVGSGRAAPVEQRRIASWAALVSREAKEGRESRYFDRTFVWRRTGGLAGLCDEVVVSGAGFAAAYSCRNGPAEPSAVIPLETEELDQLYRWVDALAPMEWAEEPSESADGFTVTLEVAGQGSKRATEADRTRMLEFANAVVRRLVTESTPPAP